MYFLQQPSYNSLKEYSWKVAAPSKYRHFLWQALSGVLVVNERLTHRHLRVDCYCPRCGHLEKTINHVIFTCPPASQSWALSNIPSALGMFPSCNIMENLDYLFWHIPNRDNAIEAVRVYPWIMWYIWKARNDKLFNNVDWSPLNIIEVAKRESKAWFLANSEIGATISVPEVNNTLDLISATFTCFVDGSWEVDDQTSRVDWVLKLQYGSFVRAQRQLSWCFPLHMELRGLLWAMTSLKKKNQFCYFL